MLICAALGAPPVSDVAPATIFTSDIGPDLTVTNGRSVNAASSIGTTFNSARANTAIPAGKYFWRTVICRGVPSTYSIYVGVGTAALSLTNYLGASAAGWAYSSNGSAAVKVNNGATTSFGANFVNGDVIDTAIDTSAGLIWWGRNGTWQGSGDPVAGTNAAFSGLSGTLYPMYTLTPDDGVYLDANAPPPAGFLRLP